MGMIGLVALLEIGRFVMDFDPRDRLRRQPEK
jgi:hypothetical protein